MNRLKHPLEYPDIRNIKTDDKFITPLLRKIAEVTLPDVWHKYENDGTEKNFINIADRLGKDEFFGTPWQDGMIYEIIRGGSDLFTEFADPALESRFDRYIDEAARAQEASGDGYINTFTSIKHPNNRFGQNGGFLIIQHDLYNAGCLFEAGVHNYIATGKKKLLSVAVKMANYICSEIGYPPKKNIVSAHPMIEQATVQLYRLMKNEPELAEELGADADAYFELSRFWIDYRGVHENRAAFPKYMREYAQDHEPLRKQKEAVGHAVRAALVYTGMAAVANETGEKELFDSSLRLWQNVTETKMHVTGGIGALKDEERFGYQYELPSDAYLETCAGVAMAFWAGEMHRTYGDSSFFDVFERVFYNNVLASLSESGVKYTYINPLVSHGDIERWDWHQCPCCPPMLLKMMGALKTYIWSYSGDDLYLNLHIGSETGIDGLKLSYRDGKLKIASSEGRRLRLHIRIPEYAQGRTLTLNGKAVTPEIENGYAVIEREFSDDDTVGISFEYRVIREESHPYVWENCYIMLHPDDRVAVRYGRFIYCAEAVDNGGDVDFVLSDAPLVHNSDGTVTGKTTDGRDVILTPYYKWNNRGNCGMRIWLKQDGMKRDGSLTGWEKRLYRPWKID